MPPTIERKPNPIPLPILKIRASSMKLAVECAAAVYPVPGETLIDSSDETSAVSQDIHRAIALDLTGFPYPPLVGDNAGEMEELVGRALTWFDETKPFGEGVEPVTELHLVDTCMGLEVSGTIDVLGIHKDRKRAGCVDWKNTYRDDSHDAQLYTYAWLVFKHFPTVEVVDIYTGFLRLNVVDHKEVTRKWVMGWMEDFVRNNFSGAPVYRAGEHCLRCRRYADCPALLAQNRQTAMTLVESVGAGRIVLTREGAANLRPKVKMLKQIIDQYDRLVKDYIQSGGPIELDNGKVLDLVQENHRVVLPVQGWEILTEEFSEGELGQIIKIPVGGIEEIIESRAPKGKKSAASKAFLGKLAAAGAMETKPVVKMKEVNPKDVEA